jgi:lipoprotein-releasing system ATP-binding protein
MSHPPTVEVRGASKVLGDEVPTTVLRHIDLRIERGELVSITGTSGSGKSTLLYLLGALDTPTIGHVEVLGHDIAALTDRERTRLRGEQLGFVFQFHFLLPEFSAVENITLPMLRAGWRPRAAIARARETLDLLDIGSLADRRPGQMSGGQQQRVAIARAVAHGPQLLLADEPTGSLDSTNTDNVFALFERLNAEHDLTIVLVTHEEALAERTRRRIVLHDGQIVRQR